MNILFSAISCDPYRGSEAGNGWNWPYYCAKLYDEVWCITDEENEGNISKKLRETGVQNLKFVYISAPEILDRFRLPSQVRMYIYYILWQYRCYKTAKKLHEAHKFDVIQHITWASLQLGSWLWKINTFMIFGPVGGGQFSSRVFKKYFRNYWKQETYRRSLSWCFLNLLLFPKRNIRNASLLLATNNETLALAKKHGATNVELFLDTCLTKDFFPKKFPIRNNPKVKILWVGRVLPRKGLELVLEALSKVEEKSLFELTILGDGPFGRYIPQWIKSYDLDGIVQWKGAVPWEEVKTSYLNHDIFFFCSLRDSFGSQLLEAMANGLPVITLDTSGAKVFVPDNAGIKVNTDQSLTKILEDLTGAVKKLVMDSSYREQLGKNGFEYAHNHTWEYKTNLLKKQLMEKIGKD